MEPEIQAADPNFKRRVFFIIAVSGIIASSFLAGALYWLHALSKQSDQSLILTKLKWMLGVSTGGIALCLLALATYFVLLGFQVRREKRWPTAGTRVLRNTTVHHGDSAGRIGKGFIFLAVVMFISALAIPAISWHYLAQLH